MSDDEKKFDNSWEAVWQREINELTEQVKHPERYSASDITFKKSRIKQLQELIDKRKSKKDLTSGFAQGQKNIKDMANNQNAMYAQMANSME